METTVLIVTRMLAAMIFAAGAVWLAIEGKEGWPWFVAAAIWLGSITYTKNVKSDEG